MRLLSCLLLMMVATAQTPEPTPAPEMQLTGFVEVGYRWRTDVAGSLDTYRSVVDLGSGPKLLGTEFSVEDQKRRLFDRVAVRAFNWGDDPYSTLNVTVSKQRLYDFSADYRNFAYFNFLPSFANPLLSQGILLNERSFDIRRRISSFRLDLLPGRWIVPYLAYERSSSYGQAITTFVGDGNEYPVPSRISDHLNNYRGGVRFELPRVNLSVEQGGTTFKDDQSLYETPGAHNTGNRQTPLLGQTLFLDNLLQAYGVRGTSIYSRATGNAAVSRWLNLSGEFLYSRPETETNYQQFNTGNFANLGQAMFVTMQERLLSTQASLPHKTGLFSIELLPYRRVRVLVSWMTDRLENSGLSSGPLDPSRTSYLQNEYNHAAGDVMYDIGKALTLRIGYRYVWGEGESVVLPVEGLQNPTRGRLQRHVFSGGLSFRPMAKVSLTADAEGAASSRTYFRTSLHDYQRAGFRARYQITGTVNLAADYRIINNNNPTPGIGYDFRNQRASMLLSWTPAGGKRFNLQGDYTWSTLRSDITYLVPQTLQPDRSFYRENGHSVGALVDFVFPAYRGLAPKVSAGGSLFLSSGSRPTSYYQPLVSASVPVTKNIAWISHWRYYGFGESFYTYEAFRTHIVETGIRLNH